MPSIALPRRSVLGRFMQASVPVWVASLMVWQYACTWSRSDADKMADCIVAATEPLCGTPGTMTTVASCTPEGAGRYLLVLLPRGHPDVRGAATRDLSELELRMLEGMGSNVPDVTMLALFNDDGFSATSRLDGVVDISSVFAVRNDQGDPVSVLLERLGNRIRVTDVR